MLAPTFKHGKYSKYLPTGLRAAYERTLRDPDLLALHDEIALCDARLTALLQQVSDSMPPDPKTWLELYTALDTRRKLSETEQKRLIIGQQMITSERAQLLVSVILETVKEQIALHVDPDTARHLLTGLSAAFSRLALLESAHQNGTSHWEPAASDTP